MQNVVQCLSSILSLETHVICAPGAAAAAKELPRGMQVAGMQLQKFKHHLFKLLNITSHNKDFLVWMHKSH